MVSKDQPYLRWTKLTLQICCTAEKQVLERVFAIFYHQPGSHGTRWLQRATDSPLLQPYLGHQHTRDWTWRVMNLTSWEWYFSLFLIYPSSTYVHKYTYCYLLMVANKVFFPLPPEIPLCVSKMAKSKESICVFCPSLISYIQRDIKNISLNWGEH